MPLKLSRRSSSPDPGGSVSWVLVVVVILVILAVIFLI